MTGQEYLTKEKFEELKGELDVLKSTKRKEIAESLEYAKSLGDLSENAEYQQARELQASTEERIAKLESILKSAVIVALHHSEKVEIGSTVTVQKDGEKDKKVFKIVGSEEADTAQGKISYVSPLGSAIMGKKKSESFAFKTPKGEVHYKVTDIA
jgi:transcription elongation factor GreA